MSVDRHGEDVDGVDSPDADVRKDTTRLEGKGKEPTEDCDSVLPELEMGESIRAHILPDELRPSPKRLPTVCFDATVYIVDERLREFRPWRNPYERIVFDSPRGQRMLRSFYVDICRTCRQEVAIRLDTTLDRVVCPACGADVIVDRSLCRAG